MAFFRDHTLFPDDWNRIRAAGAALAVNVGTVLESHAAALLLRQQVFDLAAAGQPFTLTLLDYGEGEGVAPGVVELCDLLRAALQEAGASPRHVGLVVDATGMSPRDAWRGRSAALGPGPLFVRLPQHSMNGDFWEQAWHLRGNRLLRLVYASHAVSQTRLLPDEHAPGVVPHACLQVPTGTAWVTAEVDLADLADSNGGVDETRLEMVLRDVVEHADRSHSTERWPTAQMRHDAWLNRRIAIAITGIGTVVARRGIDPQLFATLNTMNELLLRIRGMLFAATRALARRDGIVPALDQADPGRLLPGGRIGEGWAWRWQKALEAAAVRNRNLLALSPWSFFPPGPADYRFANLLPLLRHADVCAFGEPRDTAHWNLRNFRNFHQQASAVLQQRCVSHQIAVHA